MCAASTRRIATSWPAIARYKALRGQFHHGAVWQGEADDHILWQAHGEPHDLLLHVTRTAPTSWRHAPHLRLPMLDPQRSYRVAPEQGEARRSPEAG
jgi:alpha-galactosidase